MGRLAVNPVPPTASQPAMTAHVRKRFRAKSRARGIETETEAEQSGGRAGEARLEGARGSLIPPGSRSRRSLCSRGLGVLWAARVGRAGVQLRGCGQSCLRPAPTSPSCSLSWRCRAAPTPVGWPRGQSWAGGSGGTSLLLVKLGTSKITRPAENDPQSTESLPCRARGGGECLQRCLPAGKGFP